MQKSKKILSIVLAIVMLACCMVIPEAFAVETSKAGNVNNASFNIPAKEGEQTFTVNDADGNAAYSLKVESTADAAEAGDILNYTITVNGISEGVLSDGIILFSGVISFDDSALEYNSGKLFWGSDDSKGTTLKPAKGSSTIDIWEDKESSPIYDDGEIMIELEFTVKDSAESGTYNVNIFPYFVNSTADVEVPYGENEGETGFNIPVVVTNEDPTSEIDTNTEDTDSANPEVKDPSFDVTVSCDKTTAVPGDTVTYTLRLENIRTTNGVTILEIPDFKYPSNSLTYKETINVSTGEIPLSWDLTVSPVKDGSLSITFGDKEASEASSTKQFSFEIVFTVNDSVEDGTPAVGVTSAAGLDADFNEVRGKLSDASISNDLTISLNVEFVDGTTSYGSQTVTAGSRIKDYEPALTFNGDKVFTGWYTDEACTVAASSKITKNGKLYAGWTTISDVAVNDRTTSATTGKGFELYGAQIRSAQPSGLRFCTRISTAFINELKALSGEEVRYGHILVRRDLIPDSIKSVDDTAQTTNGNTMVKKYSYLDFYKSSDYIVYTAVVTGIPAANYKTNIAARPFVEYKDANGNVRTYYYTESRDGSYSGNSGAIGGAYYTNIYAIAELVKADGKATDFVNSIISGAAN